MDRSAARVRRAGTFLVSATLLSWLFGGSLALAANAGSVVESPASRLALPTGPLPACAKNSPLCPPLCDVHPTAPAPTPSPVATSGGGSSVDVIITVEIVDARCPTPKPTHTPPVPTGKPTTKPTPPTDVLGEKFPPKGGGSGGHGGGKLPYTGAPLAVAAAVSVVLVAAGLALRAAGRRPGGRHRAN